MTIIGSQIFLEIEKKNFWKNFSKSKNFPSRKIFKVEKFLIFLKTTFLHVSWYLDHFKQKKIFDFLNN